MTGPAERIAAAARVNDRLLKEAVALHRAGEMDDATLMVLNRGAIESLQEAIEEARKETAV